jgi:hypothetical protein
MKKIICLLLSLTLLISNSYGQTITPQVGGSVSFSTDGGPPGGGASVNYASKYMAAATRLRFPSALGTASEWTAAKTYQIHKTFFGTPDYVTNNYYFFLPNFYQLTTGVQASEVAAPNTITIEGLSIKVGSSWYTAGGSFPFTMDPTLDPSGRLVGPVNVPGGVPANSFVEIRVAFNGPLNGQGWGMVSSSTLGDGRMGQSTTLSAKLTDNSSVTTNANGISRLYGPAFAVAQGWDGRPVFCIGGDSISAGANEVGNTSGLLSTNRAVSGFWQRGLDDNTPGTRRLPFITLSLEGSKASYWKTRTNWNRKLDAVKTVNDTLGNVPFTHFGSNHFNNDSSTVNTYATHIKPFLQLVKSEWPTTPLGALKVVYSEPIPKAASTDAYQSLANQTPATDDAYPSGNRWVFANDIGKMSQLGDPTATARVDGVVDYSFAPWYNGSYDNSTNRDKLKVISYIGTLTADYTSNAATMTVSSTTGLSIGDTILGPSGSPSADTLVTNIAGNVISLQLGVSILTGGTVAASYHDRTGLHPGATGHIMYSQNLILLKAANGW